MENFLSNRKSENFTLIVADVVKNFEKLSCLMNLKLHFQDSHIDYFPMNLGDYSEGQEERLRYEYVGRLLLDIAKRSCSKRGVTSQKPPA